MDTHELAWAAGFYDGEGCTGIQKKTNWSVWAQETRLHKWPVLAVIQTDPRTLERFQRAVGGLGKVSGPQILKNPNHSPRWTWQARSFEHAQAVIAMLWPFLSEIKREQAVSVFTQCREHARELPAKPTRPLKTHCKWGHPMDEANTYVWPNGRRSCKECVRINGRKYRAKKRVS